LTRFLIKTWTKTTQKQDFNGKPTSFWPVFDKNNVKKWSTTEPK
jgi:hypothetical protein